MNFWWSSALQRITLKHLAAFNCLWFIEYLNTYAGITSINQKVYRSIAINCENRLWKYFMIFKKCNPSHIHLLWSFITMKCGCWPWLVCNKKEMISGLNKLWQPLAAKVSLITLTRIIWLPYINLWIQEDYYPCTQVTTVGAAAASGYSSKVLYCPAAAGESGHLLFPEAPAYPCGLDHLTSHLVVSLLHSAS